MTVDKPPLALWVQALSARVFGFNSWALLVPQALMGVATVGLAYDLARRRFGRAAGFVAGLVARADADHGRDLAPQQPGRAADAVRRRRRCGRSCAALEDGRDAWLVWPGVCVGLGFETKMAAALLVVPGIVAAWLWVAPRGRLRALRQLLAGGAAMAAVGLAWPLLIVADARRRPAVDLRHRRQLDLVADPRLQRPRPAVRPGRRARRRRGRSAAAAAAAASSAARRPGCACSTRRSAARPAGCSASRSSRGVAARRREPAAPRPTPARAG